MKIVAFLIDYPPTTKIGAPLMSAALLEALADAGHEVTVYTDAPTEPRTWHGVQVRSRASFEPFGLKADVIVAHPDGGSIGFLMGRTLRVPYVALVHNTGPLNVDYLSRYRPDLIVYNAAATAEEIGYPGVVVRSPLRVADHKIARRGADAVTLVNLTEDKGASVFYALAERLDAPFLGVRGGYGQQVEHPDLAEIVGPVDHAAMPRDVWARTAVLLVPSKAESWGRVAVEALCSGIPVVAAPTPGLREALGDAAVFVDREDLDGWADAVRALLAAPRAASSRARARAQEVEALTSRDLAAWVEHVETLRR